MRSTFRLGESREQVFKLQEADLGEHGHCHAVQSSDEIGHAMYQIDQHEKQLDYNFLAIFLAVWM